MSPFKALWGLLFRLFPCPTKTGLRAVGSPKRDSPVLVTCNFHTTVARLTRHLERAGMDAWLLVAESKGVNVWCAAGGDELNTHSVVSAIKTSGIADQVDHRTLILPPLGAPGIRAEDVRKQTGWQTRWGPVRYHDLPSYLTSGQRREETMKRATYSWTERLDTALGSLFVAYLLGGVGFAIFGRGLLLSFLAVGALTFLLFYLAAPWLPGRQGITKTLGAELFLGLVLGASYLDFAAPLAAVRAELIIAMAMLFVYGFELGGASSTLASDLDPFLARLGIGALGNVALAGTLRTELLNGYRTLTADRDTCIGCRTCAEICPLAVWKMDPDNRAAQAHAERCTACTACVKQCPTGALQAPLTDRGVRSAESG